MINSDKIIVISIKKRKKGNKLEKKIGVFVYVHKFSMNQ